MSRGMFKINLLVFKKAYKLTNLVGNVQKEKFLWNPNDKTD